MSADNMTPPHVCVVGAGVSGLKCSERLLQQNSGVKVTIYEARDRTGGRVHQSGRLGHLVDLGPSWIHGSGDNPLTQLAKDTGSTTCNVGDVPFIFDRNGERLDLKVAKTQVDEVWRMLGEGFKESVAHSKQIVMEKSLWDFVKEKVEAGNYSSEKKRNLLDHMKMWGAMTGTEIERQSFKFFWLESVIEEDSLFVASTYKKIMDAVKKKGLVGATLHLNTEVTSIAYEDDHVTVGLANGTSVAFDEVVVTCPLGWLKLNRHIFHPPLPQNLSEAIGNIGWGHLERVFVTFPTAWWHTPDGSNSCETLFISPSFSPDKNPSAWNQEVMPHAGLPRPFSTPTLRFSIYGDCSKAVTTRVHQLDPESKDYYDVLDSFFKPYYSKLANYDERSEECRPCGFECSQWQNDKWAGYGSYSNYQTGLEHADKDIKVYRAGLPERRIHFAGEAVAPFEMLGTVTGAYVSGERVAERILASYEMAEQAAENE
ncbi:FAD/NAD(P)-binding domain-containing protein [Byssothecium circinans]|uniref:FAD/NAD(P)-binding domain-containing protein n=1 Tax=Byssothecium circinans TaxID=147558 RepID=A0A6A5U2L2_9PLEO|nr:FAD/NAD(P)-binding domain-containing protein [Byssothecium circinans]